MCVLLLSSLAGLAASHLHPSSFQHVFAGAGAQIKQGTRFFQVPWKHRGKEVMAVKGWNCQT